MTESQLMDFIDCSTELKKQLKEEFYQKKIQEAKDKKNIPQFKWNELPLEIEQLIISHKENIELQEDEFSTKGYIRDVIDANHLTRKSLEEFIFDEYRNENEEKISSIPNISWNFAKFIWIMINKKDFLQDYYPRQLGSKNYPRANKHFKRITKNKSPSLEKYIEFRNKQRKEISDKKKEKNKAKGDIESKFKKGDLVHSNIDYDKCCFIITGETKTQYRVEKIEWTSKYFDSDYSCSGSGTYIYKLNNDESTWKKSKHKNLGKKAYINKLECKDGELMATRWYSGS